MKNLDELRAIKEKAKNQVSMRNNNPNQIKIVVGMGTCGIAAGSRTVVSKLLDEISKYELNNVTITQMGCIGVCELEPIVEVYESNKEKVTYVKMTQEKVDRVVKEHLLGGEPILEFTINANK